MKDCVNLKNQLMKQPISVAVDASNWMSYSSGVIKTCGLSLSHAVLLTGVTD